MADWTETNWDAMWARAQRYGKAEAARIAAGWPSGRSGTAITMSDGGEGRAGIARVGGKEHAVVFFGGGYEASSDRRDVRRMKKDPGSYYDGGDDDGGGGRGRAGGFRGLARFGAIGLLLAAAQYLLSEAGGGE